MSSAKRCVVALEHVRSGPCRMLSTRRMSCPPLASATQSPVCNACAQAQRVTSMKVTAYKCHQCGYLAERALPTCREQGHSLTALPLTKRWFSCTACKSHVSVLNKRFPDAPCRKCGGMAWKEAGMKRDSSAPAPSSEFLPRGEEVGKFRNSSAPAPSSYGHTQPAASHSTCAARQSTNAWQSDLPTCD